MIWILWTGGGAKLGDEILMGFRANGRTTMYFHGEVALVASPFRSPVVLNASSLKRMFDLQTLDDAWVSNDGTLPHHRR
jgi:hypothetical protein